MANGLMGLYAGSETWDTQPGWLARATKKAGVKPNPRYAMNRGGAASAAPSPQGLAALARPVGTEVMGGKKPRKAAANTWQQGFRQQMGYNAPAGPGGPPQNLASLYGAPTEGGGYVSGNVSDMRTPAGWSGDATVGLRKSWQPNVGTPLLSDASSALAQAMARQKQQQQATMGSLLQRAPTVGTTYGGSGDPEAWQNYKENQRRAMDVAAAGQDTLTQAWLGSKGSTGVPNTTGNATARDAAKAARQAELDTRRLMVTAKRQGKPITETQAVVLSKLHRNEPVSLAQWVMAGQTPDNHPEERAQMRQAKLLEAYLANADPNESPETRQATLAALMPSGNGGGMGAVPQSAYTSALPYMQTDAEKAGFKAAYDADDWSATKRLLDKNRVPEPLKEQIQAAIAGAYQPGFVKRTLNRVLAPPGTYGPSPLQQMLGRNPPYGAFGGGM